jgi:hypothetical protein
MHRRSIFALAALALVATAGLATWPAAAVAEEAKVQLSNKWRVNVGGKADSDGNIVFRVTPKEQAAKEVTVPVQKGMSSNQVAEAIVSAFALYLPKDGFKTERDDGNAALLRKAGKTPNFALEIVSSNALNVTLKLNKD